MKALSKIVACFLIFLFAINFNSYSQTKYPIPVEGDYIIPNFEFKNHESLPELRIHYTTIGSPVKDKNGKVINAILIMHAGRL